ncbi:MAG: hypothetical protein KJ923_03100 [Candidatus Omnitrophica bacterium]|nr:hypothetical protein [Candidatus Omnitrophota bacterium]
MKEFDFGIAWDDNPDEKFLGWLKKECSLRGLRFILIDSENVLGTIKNLERGKVKIKFLLDAAADYYIPKDPFVRLCYAVKDAEGYVVCDPDDAREASNKAITHYDLLKANIPVPYTVVVRNWEPNNFTLEKDELKRLGKPFIIKPASGFGQKGVVKDASGSIVQIARARHFNRGDNFLLQEKIKPMFFGDKEAWFRIYFLFGEIIPCWWSTETGQYGHLTLREMYNYKLLPLARISSEIARITNMEFFTTEIAVTSGEKGKERRFVAIDYVNDQPELKVRSDKAALGPVPEIIQHIAERIIEIAWKISKGQNIGIYSSIRLAKARTDDESI